MRNVHFYIHAKPNAYGNFNVFMDTEINSVGSLKKPSFKKYSELVVPMDENSHKIIFKSVSKLSANLNAEITIPSGFSDYSFHLVIFMVSKNNGATFFHPGDGIKFKDDDTRSAMLIKDTMMKYLLDEKVRSLLKTGSMLEYVLEDKKWSIRLVNSNGEKQTVVAPREYAVNTFVVGFVPVTVELLNYSTPENIQKTYQSFHDEFFQYLPDCEHVENGCYRLK